MIQCETLITLKMFQYLEFTPDLIDFDHVPTRFLINQCQIIIFLILQSDNMENSRIELKGIVLQVPSNQIKVT